MRWEDERYVRFYTRNTPEWCVLSVEARGLMGLLMREVDRAGILELGKLGLRAVAVVVRAEWAKIEGPLQDLLDDGCVVHREDIRLLVIPNFVDAQETSQSDKARQRASRERARDIARAVSLGVAEAVTNRDTTSRDVTKCSPNSVNGHSVLSRAVPSVLSRAEPTQKIAPDGAAPVRLISSRASKKKPLKRGTEAPERFAAVVETYSRLYEAARGEKPTFGSRQGAAVKRLMEAKGGADGAIATLEKAYAPRSWWRDKATIVAIAADPDKFTGAPAGRKAQAVQRGGLEEWEASRASAVAANGVPQ